MRVNLSAHGVYMVLYSWEPCLLWVTPIMRSTSNHDEMRPFVCAKVILRLPHFGGLGNVVLNHSKRTCCAVDTIPVLSIINDVEVAKTAQGMLAKLPITTAGVIDAHVRQQEGQPSRCVIVTQQHIQSLYTLTHERVTNKLHTCIVAEDATDLTV